MTANTRRLQDKINQQAAQNEGSMTDRNTKRLTDRVAYLEGINATQCTTIERLQRETAYQARQIEILKGQKR